MRSNKAPLLIMGIVLLLAALGVGAYSLLSMGKTGPMAASGPSRSSINQTSAVNEIAIQDYSFEPAAIKIKVGTKVTWTNKDSVAHTVTTDDGAPEVIDSGLFGKNKSYSFTFNRAGTYNYYCQPHPYMKGTVIVTE